MDLHCELFFKIAYNSVFICKDKAMYVRKNCNYQISLLDWITIGCAAVVRINHLCVPKEDLPDEIYLIPLVWEFIKISGMPVY